MLSVNQLPQLPEDNGYEIAFAGRSNAGKSSALNTLTEQKSLARTSKTPGRTQMLNYFGLDESRRLVDLPGYGFAKVPAQVKREWHRLLEGYFAQRQSLQGVVVVMDCRHPLKDDDQLMLQWCQQSQVPAHILLTKADKLKRGAAKTTLLQVDKALGLLESDASVQLFSALKREGVERLQQRLDQWLVMEEE